MSTDEVVQRFQSTWKLFLEDLQTAHGEALGEALTQVVSRTESGEEPPRVLLSRLAVTLLPKATAIAARSSTLFSDGLVLEGLDLGMLGMTHEESRAPLFRYLETFYVQSTAVQAGGLGAAATAAGQAGETLQEIASVFLQDAGIQESLQVLLQVLPKDPSQIGQLLPLALQMMQPTSPLRQQLLRLQQRIQEKLEAETGLLERITERVTPLLQVLKDFGLPVENLDAEGLGKLFQTLLKQCKEFTSNGAGVAGAAGGMGQLLKMVQGAGDREDLPDLDDIERTIQKQLRTEFRQGVQKENMRRKLLERQKLMQKK